MPGRDVTRTPSPVDRGGASRVMPWVVGGFVVLAVGIGLGTRLVSAGESSRRVGVERAAPATSAAPEPGRPRTASSAHTRSGAVEAAARSITAFAGDVLLDPVGLRALVARIASSASRARLTEAFEEASAQTRAKLGLDTVPRPVIVLRAAPVGYRVEHYSPREATVAVWYVGVVGSGATVQPQQSWRTQTVALVWEQGAWKVSSFASSAGPTPELTTQQAAAPGELFTAIQRFTDFQHAGP